MSINKRRATLGYACILFSVVASAGAQPGIVQSVEPHQSVSETWTTESWTGDNRPYRETRDYINQSIADGQNLNTMVQQRKVVAEKNPYDPKAEYDYAYALYRQIIAEHPFRPSDLIVVRDALDRGWPPHAYDYTRLRFLVESTLFPKQDMIQVGQRLLEHDTSDSSVQKKFFDVMVISRSITDRERALAYAQKLALAHPEDANAHGDLAGAYLSVWLSNKNDSYAHKAIVEYRQYLRFAPSDADYRKTAERLIKTIQGMVSR